jgi:hypothetical protein
MKFSIGDKIILNGTGEEGIVTAYINTEMVEVEVVGTTFPVYINDIDHPYLKWFTENKKKIIPKSLPEQLPVEKFAKPKLARGVYLSFLPEFKADVFEDEVKDLRVYLLNELPTPVYFQYKVLNNQQQTIFSHAAKLHEFGHVYLHSMPFDAMNEQPRFHWELTGGNDTNAITDGVLRVKPQKLFEHINTLLSKNEPSFSYLLVDGFDAVVKHTSDNPVKPITKPTVTKPIEKNWKDTLPHFEIDLHLENITSNTRGLTNTDKLNLQLNALQKHLNAVIANHEERTVIIHGLGKGVLKDEVHRILRELPHVSKFSNEWHGRYGFGATEVWFRY